MPSLRVPAAAAAVAAFSVLTVAPAAAGSRPADHDVSCSATFFQDDPRLGPRHLPTQGPVGTELAGYRRTGHLTSSQFLDDYFNASTNSYIFPAQSGFALDVNGNPIQSVWPLVPGQRIDRYGSEAGGFLAPEHTPFTQRALPPQSLDSTASANCNYHDYEVAKPFSVLAGPIAPWFAQPGYGVQYQLQSSLLPSTVNPPTPLTVLWLVQNGYLRPIDGVANDKDARG
jgi:Tuberculosis necrotizing toxin